LKSAPRLSKTANVFWQVGSSATLGTTSVFKGTIMANQSITLKHRGGAEWRGAGTDRRGHAGRQYRRNAHS
jgi:hypothetical protein